MFEHVNRMLQDFVKPTQKMISNLIQVELSFINTSHPDFIGGKQALAQVGAKKTPSQGDSASSAIVSGDGGVVQAASAAPAQAASAHNPNGPPVPVRPGALRVQAAAITGTPAPVPAEPAVNDGKGFFNLFRPTYTGGIDVGRAHGVDSNQVVLPKVPDRMKVNSNVSEWNRRETEIIKALISSYFDIVRKTFMDMVPKMTMHFLVNSFKNNLQNELVSQLYREDLMKDLMRENDEVASKRKAYLEMQTLLEGALGILNEVSTLNSL